jgi:hypothetical protein
VNLTPDLATFDASVNRVAPTSQGARNSANRRIAAIRHAALAAGIAAADLQTDGLSLSREHVRHGHKRVVRYRAQQSLKITDRSLTGLGALIDAVANAGADTVSDPDFGFADPDQGQELATRAALADARARANDAAAQTGLQITGVRSIDLDPESAVSTGAESEGAAAPAPKAAAPVPTHVSPGTEEFDADVRVVYTVAPAA